MPRRAFSLQAETWRQLKDAVLNLLEESPEEARHLAPLCDELEATLAEAQRRKGRLQSLKGETRFEARKLRETIARGKDLESRLRAALKALHGATSGLLVRYGIKPLPGPRHSYVPDGEEYRHPNVLTLEGGAAEAAAPDPDPAHESAPDEAPAKPES